MSVRPIDNVLESLALSGLGPCRIAGFALVAEEGVPVARLAEHPESAEMVGAFAGPYGGRARAGRAEGFEWAATLPGPEQVLSTWSDYQDDSAVCVVEGEFFSEAWGYRPRIGLDPQLARIVSQNILKRGPERLDELNGMFSGFLFSRRDRRLWLFVDRGGVRFLFYRVVNGRYEAASNIYGFCRSRTPLKLDAVSLNEHLFFGTPLDGKSLFEGVRVVQPGSVVELTSGGSTERRYYHLPKRLRRQSVAEGAEMICSALDGHVRGLGLERGRCGIGLSSGKDSRMVLAGLLRADLAPVATIFQVRDRDPDASNALRLARALDLDAQTVSFARAWDPWLFDWDSSILTLGYVAGWGFSVLGATGALHNRIMFTGYCGDTLSGASFGVRPWKAASLADLTRRLYGAQAKEMSPEALVSCLREDLVVPPDEMTRNWERSFGREPAEPDDLLTAYLLQRFRNNTRRAALNFQTMRIHAIPVHPLVDRFVMDAYLRLPVRSFAEQAAHYLAAMTGPDALGAVPAANSPVSLKAEFRMRGAFGLWKSARRLRRPRRPASPSGGKVPSALSKRHRRMLDVANESEIFRPGALHRLVQEGLLEGRGILKLGATAIHVACATNRELVSSPPPLFLTKPIPGVDRAGLSGAPKEEGRSR